MSSRKRMLYIAGYQGFKSNKFQLISEYFSDCECIQYDQTFDLETDLFNISELVKDGDASIIASSLGCLSALYAHFKFSTPTILINPSFFAEETLKPFISASELYYIVRYKELVLSLKTGNNLVLFAAKDDERVDYTKFVNIFENNIQKQIITETGGHSFSVLKDKLKEIKEILNPN